MKFGSNGGAAYVAVALLGIAGFSWAGGYVSAANSEPEKSGQPTYKDGQYAIDTSLRPLSHDDGIRRLKYKYPCQEPEGAQESELCAQWHAVDVAERSFDLAWWQLVLTTIATAGGIAAVYVGSRAVGVSKAANLQALRDANIAFAKDRARFKAEKIHPELTSTGSCLTIPIRNVGNNSADIVMYGTIISWKKPTPTDLGLRYDRQLIKDIVPSGDLWKITIDLSGGCGSVFYLAWVAYQDATGSVLIDGFCAVNDRETGSFELFPDHRLVQALIDEGKIWTEDDQEQEAF